MVEEDNGWESNVTLKLSSDTAPLTPKTVCSQQSWLFSYAKNVANLALSTTSVSQRRCLQFQTRTVEMAPRSKVAHGLDHFHVTFPAVFTRGMCRGGMTRVISHHRMFRFC